MGSDADDLPCSVLIRLPDGGTHAICHPQTIAEHRAAGRSWSTWGGTQACLEAVKRILAAVPGSSVTSPSTALPSLPVLARRR